MVISRPGTVIHGVLLFLLLSVFLSPAQAQVSISVMVHGENMTAANLAETTGMNVSRGGNALILYNSAYGQSTRTNPYGVEVIARPVGNVNVTGPTQYRVTKVTSIWECQKRDNLSACGNADIPPLGVVLSATGDKRDLLLKYLSEGTEFSLDEKWFQRKTAEVDVVDPNLENNRAACGFPGCRGGGQMIIYTPAYGKPKTGTNEFGFEVTVVNGVVVAQEGSDSAIPEEDGFVISGHGASRDWLIANAPIGAKIMVHEDGEEFTALVDFDTYVFQIARQLDESPGNLRRQIETLVQSAEQLYAGGHADQAMQILSGALEQLNRALWAQYPAWPETALKGIWHRPVEKSAQEIGETLDFLKQAGLNTVFLETFFHGYTIFPSQTLAAYGLPNQNPEFAGNDYLRLWLDEAHKRGMKIHVWFHTFYNGTREKTYPGEKNPWGPIFTKYPQWANVQFVAYQAWDQKTEAFEPVPSTLETGAYFSDPANPEVRNFLLDLIEEIVTRYDVDGFQLDYIRYPSSFPPDRYSYRKTTWGYTPTAIKIFQARYGVNPAELDPEEAEDADAWATWEAWKNSVISTFVAEVDKLIENRAPQVKLSAVVFPEIATSLKRKHQNWPQWARESWVDFLAPITLTSAVKVVEENTERVVEISPVPVVSGVFGAFNNNSPMQLLEQIEAARKAGAMGYGIFDSAHLTGRMVQALQAAAAEKHQP